MKRSISLTSARALAPDAFRRWVIGGTLLAAIGYGAFIVLDARQYGLAATLTGRNAIMCAIAIASAVIATRFNPVSAALLTLLASWAEVETAFMYDPHFPSYGVLVLPVLLLGFGLLLGTRIALVVAVVTIITTVVMHLQSPAMRSTGMTSDAVNFFVMHGIAMVSTWVLLALSLSGLTRVFDALTSKERDLADTIRFAADGILVVDRRNVVVLANPAATALLGIPRDELVDRSLDDVLGAISARREQLEAIGSERGETTHELELAPHDMGTVHVEATWRSMEGGRRQLLLRNVSERVRAEAQRRAMELQLSHAQRLDAVGRLAGGLSHDFNNILTAVSGSAELLRSETDPVEREELLDEIIAARDRGAALTRQLLAFARREVTQPRVIELSGYVRGLERLLQRVAGDRQRLRFELAPDCRVRVDPGQLEQALVNLVANARDAMPEGGWCTISTSPATDADGAARVRLQVTDEGVGMTSEIVGRAFEPFFTTKARGQGTGLGLASVHGMAEQSNGTATIQSTPRQGTRVTLDLPAALEPATPSLTYPVTAMEHAGPRSILVAEDDSGTRRIVERILTHAGFDVHAAADGTEAMAMLDAAITPFDLVLTDVMMPGHTGLEVADRVRVRHPGTPVLLMTGFAEEQLGDLMNGRDERDVITKPFSGSMLTARIAELLRTAAATTA